MTLIQRPLLFTIRRYPAVLVTKRQFSASSPPSPRPSSRSFFKRVWDAYSSALNNRPLTTKASMAAVIFFTSDTATQYLTCKDKENLSFDLQRALSGSVFGIVATGFLHVWWGFLEGFVGARLPIKTHRLSNTLVKVVVDQGLAAPFYIYNYYIITNFLQTLASQPADGPDAKSAEQIFQETRQKANAMLWPTMLRHWRLWPFVHTFNFYFVPLHHRVLVQNLVLVGWSGYLSHLNSGGLLTPKKEMDASADEKVLQKQT